MTAQFPTADAARGGSEHTTLPELLTRDEVIAYLRLDVDQREAGERLRNLVRRQGLPMIRCGRLQLFRRSAVDAWLDGNKTGGKTKSPARLVGR